jgi:hypothetical protein
MSPETVNAIKDALTPLATKLNESAEFIFKAYVVHAYALGVALILGGVLALAVGIGIAIMTWRNWERMDLLIIAAPTLAVMGGIVGTCLVGAGIMHMAAPQYYAIHDILCTVKNCTQ